MVLSLFLEIKMPPFMQRIERLVLEDKQRNKNRNREHDSHGWKEIRKDVSSVIALMDCPCGWIGWTAKEKECL